MMRWRNWRRRTVLGTAALLLAAGPVTARAVRPGAVKTFPSRVVRVQYGDSLWTLARQYGDPHRDVRAVVAAVASANNTQPGQLQPGQELLIPADCLPRR